MQHNTACADFGVAADLDITKYLCPSAQQHTIAHFRMSIAALLLSNDPASSGQQVAAQGFTELADSPRARLSPSRQLQDVPSLYSDFLAAGHEGMQHWSSWPVNYHEIRERALTSGWQIGQEGDTPRGPFIYFLNEGHPGTVIEMAEATPVRMRIFDQVREAALNWDGRDPIRMNWPQG
jgi:hypothetical protein